MHKIDFKPLLLIIPFAICIGIFIMIDHPDNNSKNDTVQSEVTQDNNEQKKNNMSKTELSESEKVVKDGKEVPINPIKTTVKRKIPDDAEIISLVIGIVGSLNAGGGDIIYEEPDEESTQLAQLQYHCAVLAHEEQSDDEWVHVKLIGDNYEGYIRKESVYQMKIAIGDIDPVRNKIVKDAVSYIGLPFKRYGNSLKDGIDCSNFVERIYNLNNQDVPNTPIELRDAGKIIPDEEAQPGDIVFYDKANNGSGHVGIYLGDGLIIHSSGHSGKTYPEGGVRISCLLYPDRDSYQMVDILNE